MKKLQKQKHNKTNQKAQEKHGKQQTYKQAIKINKNKQNMNIKSNN